MAPRIELEQDENGGTDLLEEAYALDNKKIGEGTYGQVSTATCKKTGAKVALKRLDSAQEKGEGFPITSVRELTILSSLQHKNVVNLRQVVRTQGTNGNPRGDVCMVFDYSPYDLVGLLDSNRHTLTETHFKCLIKQLLDGLDYIHSNGVLHRDLKPSNILVTKEGVVKLADFGLARIYHGQKQGMLTNRVCTLWYRPPELLLDTRKYGKYGPEVDMWSVGCILAEMLAGQALFTAGTDFDLIAQLDGLFAIMGSPTEESWPNGPSLPGFDMIPKDKYKVCQLRQVMRDLAKKNRRRPASDAALDFLERLLVVDPARRITALEAFKDPWFWLVDPAMCEPSDLPCNGPPCHEYEVKQKHLRERQNAANQGSRPSGYQAGGPTAAGGYGPQRASTVGNGGSGTQQWAGNGAGGMRSNGAQHQGNGAGMRGNGAQHQGNGAGNGGNGVQRANMLDAGNNRAMQERGGGAAGAGYNGAGERGAKRPQYDGPGGNGQHDAKRPRHEGPAGGPQSFGNHSGAGRPPAGPSQPGHLAGRAPYHVQGQDLLSNQHQSQQQRQYQPGPYGSGRGSASDMQARQQQQQYGGPQQRQQERGPAPLQQQQQQQPSYGRAMPPPPPQQQRTFNGRGPPLQQQSTSTARMPAPQQQARASNGRGPSAPPPSFHGLAPPPPRPASSPQSAPEAERKPQQPTGR